MSQMTMLANMGTPLMWLSALQLYGGNLLIAAIEAWVIRKWFKPELKNSRVYSIMVMGNYFSMFCGMFLLYMLGYLLLERLAREDAIYVLQPLIILMFVASYLITLALEWPFCFWAVGPRKTRLRDSIKAVLATQTVSYLAMLPLVLLASGYSLVTAAHPDPAIVSQAPDIATIYYLSDEDGSLCKIRLNGTRREKIQDVTYPKGQTRWTKLFLSRQAGMPSWDIYLSLDPGRQLLLQNVGKNGLIWQGSNGEHGEEGNCYWYFRPAAHVEPTMDRAWDVCAGIYGVEGLIARNKQTGQDIRLAFDTPFASWRPDNPSILPGDLLVCELGHRIILVDLNTMRIGQITNGRQPVVVLDDSALPQTSSAPISVISASQPTTRLP